MKKRNGNESLQKDESEGKILMGVRRGNKMLKAICLIVRTLA